MPRQELGTDSGSAPKALTLIQFAKQTNGKLPKISYVTVVFVPGKVPNYTLVTQHDFRVNIHKNGALYNLLAEQLSSFAESGLALAVQPDPANIGKFALLLDDGKSAHWDERDWGYRIDIS